MINTVPRWDRGRMGLDIGLKQLYGAPRGQRPSKERKGRRMAPHSTSYPSRCPLPGQAVRSELCCRKVPLPKMGKPGNKETNPFVSIHLSKRLTSPLRVGAKNMTQGSHVLCGSALLSRGDVYTPSSVLDGFAERAMEQCPLAHCRRRMPF